MAPGRDRTGRRSTLQALFTPAGGGSTHLILLLTARPGEVLSGATLLANAWDFADDGDSNVVDVHIRYLRDKIDRPFGRESIETVWGVGYRLNP